jgi:hypothetical protein
MEIPGLDHMDGRSIDDRLIGVGDNGKAELDGLESEEKSGDKDEAESEKEQEVTLTFRLEPPGRHAHRNSVAN